MRFKRIPFIIIMVATVLNFIVMTQNASATTLESDFAFDASTGKIVRYLGNDMEVDIPSQIGGVTVCQIGDNAFYNCEGLTSVILPDSVTKIGASAYADCSSLTEIIIPENVTTIGEYAFSGCSMLKDIALPNSVTSIGKWAFEECSSLMSIAIPKNITAIRYGTFSDCRSLTTISIPNNIKEIGDYSFSGCTLLKSIAIPDSIETIGASAFSRCSSLIEIAVSDSNTRYSSLDGVLFNKQMSLLIKYPTRNKNTNYIVPSSVLKIGDNAFSDCSKLEGITLAESVVSIGNSAFIRCNRLKTVKLSNGVVSIGDNAFSGCSSLISTVIPSSVTSIGSKAFNSCAALSALYFEGNAPVLGLSTFEDVDADFVAYYLANHTGYTNPWFGIPTVIYGNGTVKPVNSISIVERANLSVGQAEQINVSFMPADATNKNIIWGITTGTAVVSVSNGVITGLNPGTAIVRATSAEYSSNFSECIVTVAPNAMEDDFIFEDSTGRILAYTGSATDLVIPSQIRGVTVESIANTAFSNSISLINVSLPDTITEIGFNAFEGCANLESIRLPIGLTSIGDETFKGCSSLTGIVIPDTVTYIGDAAFENCSSLVNIVLPSMLSTLRDNALSGCSSLVDITIPDSIITLGAELFNGCSSLKAISVSQDNVNYTSINGVLFNKDLDVLIKYPTASTSKSYSIPDTVTIIGSSAFAGATTLSAITISNNVVKIGDGAFKDCSNLKTIVIPENVKEIGTNAFEGCINLLEAVIPQGVTAIDYNTFSGCTNLISVVIPSSVTRIRAEAFKGCNSLTMISIPSSVTWITRSAFENCTSLASVYFEGNAPILDELAFSGVSNNFMIYYKDGAIGFTSPWMGYTTSAYANGTVVALAIKPSISMIVGQSERIVSVVLPIDVADKNLTWQVISGNDVISVDAGVVTAIKQGTAVVRATCVTDVSKYAECIITVTSNSAITMLNKKTLSLSVGGSEKLTAVSTNPAHVSYHWTVEPVGNNVITVNDGQVTALSAGSAIVRATSTDDSNEFDQCAVTVTNDGYIDNNNVKYELSDISVIVYFNGHNLIGIKNNGTQLVEGEHYTISDVTFAADGVTKISAKCTIKNTYIETLEKGTVNLTFDFDDGNDSLLTFDKINKDECFIATAAFGSKFEPSVKLLRQFRDQCLLKTSVGKKFVEFYYKNSPPIANFIAQNEILKSAVRIILVPTIAVAYTALNPIKGTIGFLGILSMVSMIRKRRERNAELI